MSEETHGPGGGDAEQAVRAYEAALVGTGSLGCHASPEEETEHLRALRAQVLRQVEELPRASRPRIECGQCGGRREVAAVHARYGSGASPEFVTSRQRCPRRWGTGLTLNVSPVTGA